MRTSSPTIKGHSRTLAQVEVLSPGAGTSNAEYLVSSVGADAVHVAAIRFDQVKREIATWWPTARRGNAHIARSRTQSDAERAATRTRRNRLLSLSGQRYPHEKCAIKLFWVSSVDPTAQTSDALIAESPLMVA